MLKPMLSIIGGLLLAFALVFATDALFHALAPSKPPGNPSDPDAMRDYVAGQPIGLLIGLLFGWAIAAFAGSSIAVRFARRGGWPGFAVTALFLLATTANFLIVEHPGWMVVVAVISIAGAGSLGSRTFTRAAVPKPVVG